MLRNTRKKFATDYFTLFVRQWDHNQNFYSKTLHAHFASILAIIVVILIILINVIPNLYTQAKKTNNPIKTFRVQVACSKKKVNKLAVVRVRIKRRIIHACRIVLPEHGRLSR